MRLFIRHSLLAAAFVSAFGLAGCGADPERAALEQYFADAQVMSEQMVEAGDKFETLMNVQGNILSWTQTEKDELTGIRATMDDVYAKAEALVPPAFLADTHPLLIQGIGEMREVMGQVAGLAEHPETATEEGADAMMQKAEDGQTHLNQYLQETEQKINGKYPDMVMDD